MGLKLVFDGATKTNCRNLVEEVIAAGIALSVQEVKEVEEWLGVAEEAPDGFVRSARIVLSRRLCLANVFAELVRGSGQHKTYSSLEVAGAP